ncbi:hypothetical protein K0M31_009774 [Melipona bicolor]|uniref:Uncharacterized protein n=1 Tax=Melipona bicolor TaxID=60889 RepID=A0AA40FMH7_9HYME|nr:hypothetical protein K0M31_009774 [Melipona bicolor]
MALETEDDQRQRAATMEGPPRAASHLSLAASSTEQSGKTVPLFLSTQSNSYSWYRMRKEEKGNEMQQRVSVLAPQFCLQGNLEFFGIFQGESYYF